MLPLWHDSTLHRTRFFKFLLLKHGIYKLLQRRDTSYSRPKSRFPVDLSTKLKRRGWRIAQKSNDTQDVVVNNLSATLEAHRDRNRNAIVRKAVPRGMRDLYKRPLLAISGKETVASAATHLLRNSQDDATQSYNVDPSSPPSSVGPEGVHKASNESSGETQEVPCCSKAPEIVPNQWPADSVQAERASKERWASKQESPVPQKRRLRVLEYNGSPQLPQQRWALNNDGIQNREPWLEYMEECKGDRYELLVSCCGNRL